MEYTRLNNGVEMPILGFGTFMLQGDECEQAVAQAIQAGYRMIDTAEAYGNEAAVGRGIKASGVKREELFLVTKVNYKSYEDAAAAFERSLEYLQTDYVDLLLLHWPFANYYAAWRVLERLYAEGRVRAIGVSNFYPDRLVDICSFARIKPMVNQVETHPLNQQVEAKKWMDKYGVQIEAWAPFGEGRGSMFQNPVLNEIGK